MRRCLVVGFGTFAVTGFQYMGAGHPFPLIAVVTIAASATLGPLLLAFGHVGRFIASSADQADQRFDARLPDIGEQVGRRQLRVHLVAALGQQVDQRHGHSSVAPDAVRQLDRTLRQLVASVPDRLDDQGAVLHAQVGVVLPSGGVTLVDHQSDEEPASALAAVLLNQLIEADACHRIPFNPIWV